MFLWLKGGNLCNIDEDNYEIKLATLWSMKKIFPVYVVYGGVGNCMCNNKFFLRRKFAAQNIKFVLIMNLGTIFLFLATRKIK